MKASTWRCAYVPASAMHESLLQLSHSLRGPPRMAIIDVDRFREKSPGNNYRRRVRARSCTWS